MPLLRGWAILAVLANHATGSGFVAMFWWAHRYRPVTSPNYDQLGTLSYHILTAINQLAMFSVPAFLFMSGLFITFAVRGSSPVLSWKVIRARLVFLLWPFLIWSILVFAVDGLLGTFHSPTEYLVKLVTGNATGAYFFVPLLVQFYLLSPFLVRWAKARPRSLLAVSALLQWALVSVPYLGAIIGRSAALYQVVNSLDWVFVRWSFYFILGLTFGFHSKSVGAWLARHRLALLIGTIILGSLSVLECQLLYRATSNWKWAYTLFKLSSTLYAVAFVLTFLACKSSFSVLSRTVEQIGKMSYGIYLIHPKVLELMAKVAYHVAPGLLAHQLVLAFLLFVGGLGGAWSLVTIAARSPLRRVYRYVFG